MNTWILGTAIARLLSTNVRSLNAVVLTEPPGMLCLCVSAQVESPETVYDFGTVPQGTKIVHRFSIHNSTPVPVTVQGLEISMPGMTARFGALIAPGLDRSIAIEWDTSHVASEIEGQAIVHFGDTSQAPVTLRLKGVVQPPLEILPFPAIFLSAFRVKTLNVG